MTVVSPGQHGMIAYQGDDRVAAPVQLVEDQAASAPGSAGCDPHGLYHRAGSAASAGRRHTACGVRIASQGRDLGPVRGLLDDGVLKMNAFK
jgi:hypothetical protein